MMGRDIAGFARSVERSYSSIGASSLVLMFNRMALSSHADRLLAALLLIQYQMIVQLLVGGFAEQRGEEGEAIGFADFLIEKVGGGGKKIPEGGDVVGNARFDRAGPAGDEGNADAAFVDIAPDTAQRTVAVEKLGGVARAS